MCGVKLRNSCWACIDPGYVETHDDILETYYATVRDLEIWEYDEDHVRFTILTLPKGHKVTLVKHPEKKMRERYFFERPERIDDTEYDRIQQFNDERNWR